MEKQKDKEKIIYFNDFNQKDRDDFSDKKEKIIDPFEGDSRERFNFLHKNFKKIKEIIIKKYLEKQKIPVNALNIDYSLSLYQNHFDPIMLTGIKYDGCVKYQNQKMFFGVLFNNRIHPSYDSSYYNRLAQLYFYKKNNIENISFILILADIPKIDVEFDDLERLYSTKRFMINFKPAIEKNWLILEKIKFSNKDFNEWYNMIEFN